MKKRIILLLLALVGWAGARADVTFTIGDLTYTSNDGKTCAVKAKDKQIEGDLIIPATVNNDGVSYNVIEIDYHAFDSCTRLTSVVIPESVTSIGSSAFESCSGLTSVVIPEGVTSIADGPFWGCSGLTSVVVDANNTTYDSRNNCNAIIRTSDNTLVYGFNCSTIPEGVTSIGSYAFSDCRGLTSLVIPEGVTSIGGSAFWGCSGLTSVVIPEGVTSIGDYAFAGCSGLTSVVIPEGVTSIGAYEFFCCSGLTSLVIPEGVTSIGTLAFGYCYGLTSVVIPKSVTSIGDKAFGNCLGLTSVDIPEGVKSIGNSAFTACLSLTSMTIPASVKDLGNYMFSDCDNMKELYMFCVLRTWTKYQCLADLPATCTVYTTTETEATKIRKVFSGTVVVMTPEEAAGVAGTTTDSTPAAYYDLSGHRITEPKGITIIRYADGKSRKVMKK